MKIKIVLDWIISIFGTFIIAINSHPRTYMESILIVIGMLLILVSQDILDK